MKPFHPIVSTILFVLAVMLAGWSVKSCKTWWKIDACLDRGGAWDKISETCRF